jgi:hypothetical protein
MLIAKRHPAPTAVKLKLAMKKHSDTLKLIIKEKP